MTGVGQGWKEGKGSGNWEMFGWQSLYISMCLILVRRHQTGTGPESVVFHSRALFQLSLSSMSSHNDVCHPTIFLSLSCRAQKEEEAKEGGEVPAKTGASSIQPINATDEAV
jgi:hypothetical protein